MPPSDSQTFLRELDKKLWTAADRLRSNLDAAVYKHAAPRSGGLRTTPLPNVESAALFGRASFLPHSSSAFLGDLCAFAVQNSSMAIRSIDFNFGKEPANSFTHYQHPDVRADYVMAIPPFNDFDWFRKDDELRCQFGFPPNLEIEPPSLKENSVSQKAS